MHILKSRFLRGVAVLAGVYLASRHGLLDALTGFGLIGLTVPATFPARDESDYRHSIKTFRKLVNFNDANIATGVKFGRLPVGAFLLRATCQIIVAFNAATTNVLTFGTTSTSANELSGSADINEATLNTLQACLASGATGVQLTTGVENDLFVKYTQTGGVATAGQAIWVLEYIANVDG